MLTYHSKPLFLLPYPKWKRLLDFTGALVAIILFSPLLAATAIAVGLTSPGPILFRQARGGYGGRAFTMYKFRSMVADAEARKPDLLALNERSHVAFKLKNDPRITPVGQFIRKASLDELPQLFNVLKGEMSLVGPRPLPMEEQKEYALWHRRRLEAMPGLTGLWQVSSRDDSDFDNWVRMDIRYIEEHSFVLDFVLLLKTIPAVLFRRGAS